MINSVIFSSDDKGLFAKYAACGKQIVSLAEQGALATTTTKKFDTISEIKTTLYRCWLTDATSINVPTYKHSELAFGKKGIIVFHPSMNSAAPVKKDSDHTPAN
jgi:hypothetical protein